eukprot:TRINITY_DN6968_c0_g1_i1.p1 TRINITY_DN6968_c0_g1~~TRINITY_DN6968_c0_g1_i1.p1  ORF type:complete len:464 (+),score=143.66 TRINITY_DN6968_c0_g1_i1:202-1593(+)
MDGAVQQGGAGPVGNAGSATKAKRPATPKSDAKGDSASLDSAAAKKAKVEKAPVGSPASPSPLKKKESPASSAAANAGKCLLNVFNLARPGGLMANLLARGTLPANGVLTPSKQASGETPTRSTSAESLVAQTPPRGSGSNSAMPASPNAATAAVAVSPGNAAAEDFRRLRKNGKQAAEAASPSAPAAAAGAEEPALVAGATKAASSSTAAPSKAAVGKPAAKGKASARKAQQPFGFDDDSDWVGPRIIRQMPPPGRSGSGGTTGKSPAKPQKQRPPVPQMMPLSPVVTKKPRQPEAWEVLRKMSLPPQKPEDTYEVSDKEDSGDEEAVMRSEEARRRKKVPSWCDAFEKLANDQAGVDPDTIFGSRVPTCDLDSIFPDSLYKARGRINPRRRRGSSQLWGRDRLQVSEVIAYRQKMQQTRRWSSLMRQKQFIAPKRTAAARAAAAEAGGATGSKAAAASAGA